MSPQQFVTPTSSCKNIFKELEEPEDLEDQLQECQEESEEALHEPLPSGPPWGKIWKKIFVTVIVFLVFTFIVEKYAQGPVTRFSTKLMKHIGLPGLFIGVLLADGMPQPFTYVPLIFMAEEASISKRTVFMVCASASYTAAMLGYLIGSCLRRPKWGKSVFDRLSSSYPWLPHLMKTKGFVGVLSCAVLPVPLAMATWTAGFFGVKFHYFVLAAFGRFPKILVFVLLSGLVAP